MVCLSKDKERIVDSNRFSITEAPEVLYIKQNNCESPERISGTYYSIVADNCIMEIFETKEKAISKLMTVLRSLAEGTEIFEF